MAAETGLFFHFSFEAKAEAGLALRTLARNLLPRYILASIRRAPPLLIPAHFSFSFFLLLLSGSGFCFF